MSSIRRPAIEPDRFLGYFGKSRQTPTRYQSDVSECAAVCLAIMLEYHGLWKPLHQLRALCNVSRDGCSAADVLIAARAMGFRTEALRLEPHLLRLSALPCIIFWNQSHFVVLEEFSADSATINDPDLGRRRLTLPQFAESYSGVSLHLYPTENIEKSKRPSLLRRCFRWADKSVIVSLCFVFLLSIMVAGIDSASPFVLRTGLFSQRHYSVETFKKFAIALSVIGFGRILLAATAGTIQQYLSRTQVIAQVANTLDHLFSLPAKFFTSRSEVDLILKLQSAEEVVRNSLDLYLAPFVAVLTTLAYLSITLSISGLFGLILLFNVTVSATFFIGASRLRRNWNLSSIYLAAKRQHQMRMTVREILMVKVNGRERGAFRQWLKLHNATSRFEQRLQLNTALLQSIPSLVVAATTVLIILTGSARRAGDLSNLTLALTLMTIVSLLLSQVSHITDSGDTLQQLQVATDRHEDILLEPKPVRPTSATEGRPIERPHLRAHDISFGYGKRELISGFSIDLPFGSSLAIAGETGSGKSTLAHLLTGLTPPRSGEISLNDEPLETISSKTSTKLLLLVEQRPFLFQGTLIDNLSMGEGCVETNYMRSVLQATKLTTLLNRDPLGLAQPIDYNNVSGGQAQRIHLARALMQRPKILVLDEATNLLDQDVENSILDFIHCQAMTLLVIGHRFSALRRCKQAIVLKDGQVIEAGTISELVASKNTFWNLVRDQYV